MKSEKYDRIFEQNKEWLNQDINKNIFAETNKSQSPEFLYIGCSDSRVPANSITGLEIGDLFVHRNIANLVPNTDLNVQSVIQYAVEILKVKHILVCGHYGCEGVRAAIKQESFGLIDNWLRNIRDIYRTHYNELELIPDEEKKLQRLVELNVIEQCKNVIKTSYVQSSYLKNGFPIVHGWVYNMKNGQLADLDIDFENTLAEIQKVFNLK